MKRIQVKRHIAKVKKITLELKMAESKLADLTSSKFWRNKVAELKAKLKEERTF